MIGIFNLYKYKYKCNTCNFKFSNIIVLYQYLVQVQVAGVLHT